ncbi:MAG: cell division protein ZapA [Fermentimonas sp.]|jgi:cell division protein ZapA (FtsZ GTPase activity inhibitor)
MHKFIEVAFKVYVMVDDRFILTLEIAGKKYPLRIKRSEEEAFRAAEKNIEDRINKYRIAFGGESSKVTMQDYLAMIAIQACAENFSLSDRNDTKPYEDKINSLINELDVYLKK